MNAERGEVWLQTDDEGGVLLRLGASELCTLETMLDEPLGAVVERFNASGLGLRDLRAVLAAAMQ
ncbi:MAG: GTA-gp10 family protein, partial [Guyparkeria sp.]